MAKNISENEGFGDVYAAKLAEIGVTSVEKLLNIGATPKGRRELEQQTGISHKLILRWVNHADLFRIKGIASEYAELLEAAGVDTVPELAQRNPANLQAKMVEVNQAKELVRQVPGESLVADWITQAKGLDRIVQY